MTEYARAEADIRKRVRVIRAIHDGKEVRDASEHILNAADTLASLAAERDALMAQRERLATYMREVETNLPIVHWKKARANHLTEEDMALLDRP